MHTRFKSLFFHSRLRAIQSRPRKAPVASRLTILAEPANRIERSRLPLEVPGDSHPLDATASVRFDRWVFVPDEPDPDSKVFHQEPFGRATTGKLCFVDELAHSRGERVWYHPLFAPIGITDAEFARQPRSVRGEPDWSRRTRVDGTRPVYVRGAVRCPDHPPLHLRGWHRVYVLND